MIDKLKSPRFSRAIKCSQTKKLDESSRLDVKEVKNMSNIQISQNKPILKQNISCLYSDTLYKSQDDQLIKQMHIQKYRHLFQHQKREKNDLFQQVQNLKNKIGILEKEKQTVNFAYKLLQIKKKRSQQPKEKRRKSFIQLIKRDSIKYQQELRQKLQLSTQNKSRLGALSKPRQSCNSDLFKSQFSQVSVEQQINQIKQVNQPNAACDFNPRQSNFQRQEADISDQREQEANISDQQKQWQEMQLLINQKDQLIKDLQKKLNQQQQQIFKLDEKVMKGLEVQKQLRERNLQISEAIQTISKMELQIQFHKRDAKQNLQNYQNLKRQLQEKSRKQEKELARLHKFSDELKISDDKIRQFMIEQFGQDFGTRSNQKIVYKENISYLLHLTKKKQSLYEAAVAEMNRSLNQLTFTCQLLQKKNDQTIKIYERLVILAQKGQFVPLANFIMRAIK